MRSFHKNPHCGWCSLSILNTETDSCFFVLLTSYIYRALQVLLIITKWYHLPAGASVCYLENFYSRTISIRLQLHNYQDSNQSVIAFNETLFLCCRIAINLLCHSDCLSRRWAQSGQKGAGRSNCSVTLSTCLVSPKLMLNATCFIAKLFFSVIKTKLKNIALLIGCYY